MVKKRKNEEEKDDNPITKKELDNYIAAIAELPQIKIDGEWITRRERYLISIGAMKFSDRQMIVIDPFAVSRIDKLEDMRPKVKYIPPKSFWDEIRRKNKLIMDRIISHEKEN